MRKASKSPTDFLIMPASEEAHWSSFRSAIADLQPTLTGLGSNTNNSNYASINYRAPENMPPSHPYDISEFRLGSNTIIEDFNSTKSHRHLELIGLDEVDRSVYNRNNQADNELEQHAQSSAHSTHSTMALSITAQQLSEMRLKLALTESERDELEFQLMQKR